MIFFSTKSTGFAYFSRLTFATTFFLHSSISSFVLMGGKVVAENTRDGIHSIRSLEYISYFLRFKRSEAVTVPSSHIA